MKKIIKKNIKQRYIFKKFEKKKLILKAISNNLNIEKKNRWKIQQYLFNFDNNCSLTRIKNRCILTGRGRSIHRFFKISRIKLRNLANKGFLPGIHKYSW